MDQVRRHRLPPNPAKMSDARAQAFVAEHGASSWELDALRADVLLRLIREAIEEIIDRPKYDAWLEKEETGKDGLREATKKIMRKGG